MTPRRSTPPMPALRPWRASPLLPPLLLLLLQLSVLAQRALGFEFIMNVQRKCIYEEIKAGNIVVGDYSAVHHDTEVEQYLHIRVDDPYGNPVHEKATTATGTFAFTAAHEGEYRACFMMQAANNEPPNVRVRLDWKVGVAATDWASIAKKEHLDSLTVELRRLEDGIRQVYADILEMQNREQQMRDVSEVTNARVAWYSVYALIVCIVSGVWQIWYLRKFFQRKKLM